MATLDVVAGSELLRGLSTDVVKSILPFCREAQYPRGATIFEEGAQAQHLAVLEYGLVTLRIDSPLGGEKVMVTAIRDAGEIFGWSALIEPCVYTSSAVCLEPSHVILVDGSALLRFVEENPEAGVMIMKNVASVIASRLRKARAALASALVPGLISHG